MNFKYYDLLSHLIPGFLLILVFNHIFKFSFSEIDAIPQIALAFIAGYFVNTFSSWLEGFYRFLWGGNPINDFFEKNGIWKVRFYNGEKVKEILIKDIENSNQKNLVLFHKAMKIANESSSKRLEDFNAIYAFSRSLLTAIFVSGLVGLTIYYDKFWYYGMFFIVFLISLIRCKQKNGYYIREVLNLVLKNQET